MGQEYLLNGFPQVYRTADREELLEIKEGRWSLEKLQQLYSAEMLKLEQAYTKSTIQDKDTKHNVNKLLFDVMDTLF